MKCRNKECDSLKTKIVKTEEISDDTRTCVVRIRRCDKCGNEFRTLELAESSLDGALGLISASTVLAKCMIFGASDVIGAPTQNEENLEEGADQEATEENKDE